MRTQDKYEGALMRSCGIRVQVYCCFPLVKVKRYCKLGCKGTLKEGEQTSTTLKCVEFGSIENRIVFGLGTVGRCGQYCLIHSPYVLYKVVPVSINLVLLEGQEFCKH